MLPQEPSIRTSDVDDGRLAKHAVVMALASDEL
jgi:hypothetical protein